MRLGIYGGSFDPVHLGHLLAAQAAREELALDKLFFVPAAQSPFKTENRMTPVEIRLRLLRLALAGQSHCAVDDQEIRRGGVSYAVETVRDYARRFPGATLFYLIGSDHVAKLNQWHQAGELARLTQFAVVPRPGEGSVELPRPFRGIVVKGFPTNISSSEIRARVRAGLPIEALVPPFVAEAVCAAKLYL
ncbi:MAG TPA: nicotinate-nucleotide adenylyltransferase [Verrucomicrobiae bacterium]|nr:nicotinate-nucleotide adenylyltransferase [Verrucomicrobiae bacterium]